MTGFFSEELLDDIRGANPIEDVVSEFLPLKKSGRNFKGLCPFHSEKTPSFMVNPERQIFHCFGCSEGGNVFSFIMKQQNVSFPEAVRHLAGRGGVSIPETLPPRQRERAKERDRLLEANEAAQKFFSGNLAGEGGEKAAAYFEKRGMSRKTIETFGLGYALPGWDTLLRALRRRDFSDAELSKAGLLSNRSSGGYIDRFRDRIIFPVRNVQGGTVAFGGRSLGDGEPKYLNSPETPLYNKSKTLYGLHEARQGLRKENFGVIVEGYFDCLVAHQAGIENVVATSGTALTEGHLDLMRRYADRWTVVFDGDAAGIRAAKRSLELFITAGLLARGVLLPEGEDPDSYICRHGADAFRALLDKAPSLMEFFIDRTAQEQGTDSVEGKVTAVREIVPLLKAVARKIEQAEYVAFAAHRLQVKEDVLWAEVQNAPGARRSQAPAATSTTVPLGVCPVEEKGIVRAMLRSTEAASRMRGTVDLAEFEDADCKAVAGKIFALIDEGVREGLGERLQFENDGLNRLVASWLIEEGDIGDDGTALQEAQDCLARIRRRRVDQESRLLQEKIAAAEKAGDTEILQKLLRVKQGLRLQPDRHS